MNFRRARIIFLKEMLETFRDKRTLFIMILGPVLIYPLVIIVSMQMHVFQESKTRQMIISVEVAGGENSPEIYRLIKENKSFDVLDLEGEGKDYATTAIGKSADVRVIIGEYRVQRPETDPSSKAAKFFRKLLKAASTARLSRVTVVYNSTTPRSMHGKELLDHTLLHYSRRMVRRDIAEIGKYETFDYPLIRSESDISTGEQKGGHIMGSILPIILVMMTIAGAMYPAIDTTAGEKERGTIETILTVPASKTEIVLGKFFSVFLMSIMTGLLNLIGMAVTFSQFLFLPDLPIDFSIPTITFALIFLFLVPLALLFSSLMMAVATYARTFKEAQNYVSIIYVICIFPALLSTTRGFELSGYFTIMPVANLALLFKEMINHDIVAGHIALVFLSTSVYAGLALYLTVRLFHKESVLFSSEKPFSLFVRRRFLSRREKPYPAEGLFLIAICFVLFFSAGSIFQSRNLVWGLVATQIVLILVPALLFASYLKLDFKKSFSIRRPRLNHMIAGVLLGLSSVVIAQVIVSLQSVFYDPMKNVDSSAVQDAFLAVPLPIRLLVIALLPAICEEILFRGFVLSAFSSRMRAWKAIVLSGIFFGFFHVMVWISQGIPTAHIVLGIFIGYVVYRSGSIFTGMIFHFVYNGTLAVLMDYSDTEWLGRLESAPAAIVAVAVLVFVGGIALTVWSPRRRGFDTE